MTDAYRDSRGRFLPGNAFGKGRAIGSRNHLGKALIEALVDDFDVHGTATVELVRETRPVDYLKICLSLIPKDYTLTINPITDLTDDELHARLRTLDNVLTLSERGTPGGDGGTGAAETDCQSPALPALPAPKGIS